MTETTTHGTMTSASDSAAQVQEYVSAVRAALSDLSLEEVEDLTAGMDADLGELLAERGGTLEVALGSPQAYAAELRTAAGLPAACACCLHPPPCAEVIGKIRRTLRRQKNIPGYPAA